MLIIKYCNIPHRFLIEDGILDAENRKTVNKVVNQILLFLQKSMSIKERYALYLANSKTIPMIKQTLELNTLQKVFIKYQNNILFTEINTDFGVINLGIDLGNNILDYGVSDTSKNILILKGLSNDGILRLRDILYLYYHTNTLIHELIHFLDKQRISDRVKIVKYSKDNEEEYFNSPKEFNAWSQEIFSYLEMNVLDKVSLPEVIDLPWVHSFLDNTFSFFNNTKTKSYEHFLSKLNEKNKHRFYKRLLDNFKKVWINEYNIKLDQK